MTSSSCAASTRPEPAGRADRRGGPTEAAIARRRRGRHLPLRRRRRSDPHHDHDGATDTVLTLHGPNDPGTVVAWDDDRGRGANARIVRRLDRGRTGSACATRIRPVPVPTGSGCRLYGDRRMGLFRRWNPIESTTSRSCRPSSAALRQALDQQAGSTQALRDKLAALDDRITSRVDRAGQPADRARPRHRRPRRQADRTASTPRRWRRSATARSSWPTSRSATRSRSARTSPAWPQELKRRAQQLAAGRVGGARRSSSAAMPARACCTSALAWSTLSWYSPRSPSWVSPDCASWSS